MLIVTDIVIIILMFLFCSCLQLRFVICIINEKKYIYICQMLGCGKFLSVGDEFVVQQVELL